MVDKSETEYQVLGMSRAAWTLQRDQADLEFALHHGLPAWLCESYEDAIRYNATQLIAAGMRK